MGLADLVGVGVRQPDPRDLAGVGDLLQRADDVGVVDLWIGAVVLPQRDLLDAEPLQAGVDGLLEVAGRAVGGPATAVGAHVATLGGEHHVLAHAELVEQPGDQPLVLTLRVRPLLVPRPVGVGGVEERDAGVERGADRVGELLARLGAGLVEGHEAEADGAHLLVADLSCLHASGLPDGASAPLHPVRGAALRGRSWPRA